MLVALQVRRLSPPLEVTACSAPSRQTRHRVALVRPARHTAGRASRRQLDPRPVTMAPRLNVDSPTPKESPSTALFRPNTPRLDATNSLMHVSPPLLQKVLLRDRPAARAACPLRPTPTSARRSPGLRSPPSPFFGPCPAFPEQTRRVPLRLMRPNAYARRLWDKGLFAAQTLRSPRRLHS